jgi:hypothetical protein
MRKRSNRRLGKSTRNSDKKHITPKEIRHNLMNGDPSGDIDNLLVVIISLYKLIFIFNHF